MSQANLSEILGVSKQAVSKWERGVCFPDIELRYDISEALNIPIEMLLFPFSDKYFPFKLKPSDSEDETDRTFFELQEDESIEDIYMQESYYQLYRNCLLYNPIFALPDFLRFFLIPRLSHFPKEKDYIKILKGKKHVGKLEKTLIPEYNDCLQIFSYSLKESLWC